MRRAAQPVDAPVQSTLARTPRVRVKFCGLTRSDDVRLAAALGVDALGLVFAPSPRRITIEAARDMVASISPLVSRVGVFVNEQSDDILYAVTTVGLNIVQLHGDETPADIAALRARLPRSVGIVARVRVTADDSAQSLARKLRDIPAEVLPLLDPGAGSGQAFDWPIAADVCRTRPVLISGGLTPETVGAAIAALSPHGVDVSSGIESAPGVKDPARMQRFIDAVRQAEARNQHA